MSPSATRRSPISRPVHNQATPSTPVRMPRMSKRQSKRGQAPNRRILISPSVRKVHPLSQVQTLDPTSPPLSPNSDIATSSTAADSTSPLLDSVAPLLKDASPEPLCDASHQSLVLEDDHKPEQVSENVSTTPPVFDALTPPLSPSSEDMAWQCQEDISDEDECELSTDSSDESECQDSRAANIATRKKISIDSMEWNTKYAHMLDPEPAIASTEEMDIDMEHLSSSQSGLEYRRFLQPGPIPAYARKPIFKPRGKWEFSNGMDIENVKVIKCLGEGAFAKGYIKTGTIYGEPITYISKEWDLSRNHVGFFSELALYEGPKYLRSLQGDCIPRIIGIYKNRNLTSVAFELPHSKSWREADSDLPLSTKERIIEAYQKIHDRGVLHNDVNLRHILVGDDDSITIIDFNIAQALDWNFDVHLDHCSPTALEEELRKVKVKLRYPGAVEHERQLVQQTAQLASSDKPNRKRKASAMLQGSQTEEELAKWMAITEVAHEVIVPLPSETCDDESFSSDCSGSDEDEDCAVPVFATPHSSTTDQPQKRAKLLSLPGLIVRKVGCYLSSILGIASPPSPSPVWSHSLSPTQERPTKKRKLA